MAVATDSYLQSLWIRPFQVCSTKQRPGHKEQEKIGKEGKNKRKKKRKSKKRELKIEERCSNIDRKK